MSIVLSISLYEGNSQLSKHFLEIKDDWYGWIFRKIVPFNDINKLTENKVSFITFNYDRSLEYYLLTSLYNSFGFVNKSVIKEKFSSIPFVHVYGKLGTLEEMDDDFFRFGKGCNFQDIIKLKDNIRTMHERSEARDEKIDRILTSAEKIYILGFGFDKENVRFLNLNEHLKSKPYSTYISNYDYSDEKMISVLNQAGFKDCLFNIRKGSCLKVLEENL